MAATDCCERRGNVVGRRAFLDALPVTAFRVPSWHNSSPTTQGIVIALISRKEWVAERLQDPRSAKKLHVLLVYNSEDQRLECLDCLGKVGEHSER